MTREASLLIVVVVPAGTHRLAPLVDALDDLHDDADITAVWAGDPHLRPTRVVPWIDLDLAEPSGVGWGRLLGALPARSYEWVRAGRALGRELAGTSRPAVVLRAGSVGVAGDLTPLVPATGLAVAHRTRSVIPADGLAPSTADLAADGHAVPSVLAVAADAVAALDRFSGAMAGWTPPGANIGAVFSAAVAGANAIPHGFVVCAGWSPASATIPPSVVDVDALDPAEPWHVDFGWGREPRHKLSHDPVFAAALEHTAPQREGAPGAVVAPGGIAIDRTVRSLMSDAIDAWRRGTGDLPPDPFADADFLGWLEAPSPRAGGDVGRYFFEEWASRPDLHAVFPDPTDRDRDRFLAWANDSWTSDSRSPRLHANPERPVEPWTDGGTDRGVNLIGYVASDSGLGDHTRRMHLALTAADVPVGALHYHRTASPEAHDVPELADALRYDTNLITVHIDQMVKFDADHGAEVFPERRSIGYWFWELALLPERLAANVRFVDEVWAATTFIADGFRAVSDAPVRVVPIPVPRPALSRRTRPELGLPPDRFAFLMTFDHLSITERKNPIGVIAAFERAFPSSGGSGPVLVVKTLNAAQRWAEHERIQLAAASRDDVIVMDRHMARPDQMALIEAADCLVSLHRSEGLGLHLLEAMWLRTPVIATRYSGNLDAMDDHNSALVDAELVPVTDREGYYPAEAVWADPDLDQAVDLMRRAVDDRAWLDELAANAHRTMRAQPSLAETGRTMAGHIGLTPSREGA